MTLNKTDFIKTLPEAVTFEEALKLAKKAKVAPFTRSTFHTTRSRVRVAQAAEAIAMADRVREKPAKKKPAKPAKKKPAKPAALSFDAWLKMGREQLLEPAAAKVVELENRLGTLDEERDATQKALVLAQGELRALQDDIHRVSKPERWENGHDYESVNEHGRTPVLLP